MKREIKFRVWDSISKKMHQWEEIKEIPIEKFKLEHYIIMQYIGLKAFDQKEVYEFDIVKIINKGYGCFNSFFNIGVVKYLNHGNPSFQAIQIKKDFPSTFNLQVKKDEIQIIGNIYETPELL